MHPAETRAGGGWRWALRPPSAPRSAPPRATGGRGGGRGCGPVGRGVCLQARRWWRSEALAMGVIVCEPPGHGRPGAGLWPRRPGRRPGRPQPSRGRSAAGNGLGGGGMPRSGRPPGPDGGGGCARRPSRIDDLPSSRPGETHPGPSWRRPTWPARGPRWRSGRRRLSWWRGRRRPGPIRSSPAPGSAAARRRQRAW